jgi:hypothetical protein
MYFICVQAEAGSLSQATLEDGYRLPARTRTEEDDIARVPGIQPHPRTGSNVASRLRSSQ